MARSVIILDMDGTLVDTMSPLTEILLGLAKDNQPNTEESALRQQIRDALHLPPARLVPELSTLVGWVPSEFHAKVAEIVRRLPPVLFPEVQEFLTSMKAANLTVLLSSNTPEHAVQDRLTAAGIAEYFDFALGTNVPKGVTKEDHPRLAAELLGVSLEELASIAVFVGDTPGDMLMARRAGMRAIGRVSGNNAEELTGAGADHLVNNLIEVGTYLT